MNLAKELLPVTAILVVLVSMALVDMIIIADALRALTIVPMIVVLLLWSVATVRVRRQDDVR
ncbi:MAG: hypothetical protein ACTSYL_10980 [Candidatus Thorarchaeota archaeon]